MVCVSSKFVSRFKTCKELGANFRGFFFNVWGLWGLNRWGIFVILLWGFSKLKEGDKPFFYQRREVIIKLLFNRLESLVSRKIYIEWPRLYEIPLKCCIPGVRFLTLSVVFPLIFCCLFRGAVRKCSKQCFS